MKIEFSAVWAAQWYFFIIPSICIFFDRNERAFGLAFAWLNFMVGVQASKKK